METKSQERGEIIERDNLSDAVEGNDNGAVLPQISYHGAVYIVRRTGRKTEVRYTDAYSAYAK